MDIDVGQLVIVQPTPFCNIDCTYCYLPDRTNKSRMSDATLSGLFRRVFEESTDKRPISFVWHSGEPLALPIDYYRRAFAIAEKENEPFGRIYSHGIQTNATLLDSDWAAFLAEAGVSVCISLDGPAHVHDRVRVDRRGRGTHRQVMNGVRALQNVQLPFSVICVLTHASLAHADDLYDFFVGSGIRSIAFNVDEIEGPYKSSSFAKDGAIESYIQFHKTFLNRVEEDAHCLEIREYTRVLGVIAANRTSDFIEGTNRPFDVLSIDWKGNFSTFSPELLGTRDAHFSDFILGNVLETTFKSAESSDPFRTMNLDIQAGVEKCKKECEYWQFCGGGSPANKYFEAGSFRATETLFCRVHVKALVDSVLGHIESRFPQLPVDA